jgi:sugar lactone lactonase YvrE
MSDQSTTRELGLVATGYELVEAPMPDGRGGLYFTDARTGVIYHRDGNGRTAILGRDRICGGMALHRDGSLVLSGPSIAELTGGHTWRTLFEILDRDGVATTFNDIVALPDGSIVGGTLKWPPHPDGRRVAIDGELWRVTAAGEARVVYAPVGISNGVEVTPGGDSIFFADTKNRRILHLKVTDGAFHLIAEISTHEVGKPDGLAVDEEGCVWAAIMDGGVVARFAPNGDVLETVDIPARKVTSLAFAGIDSTELLVGTGTVDGLDDQGGSIFRLDAGVAGAAVYAAAI